MDMMEVWCVAHACMSSMLQESARTIHMLVAIPGQLLMTVVLLALLTGQTFVGRCPNLLDRNDLLSVREASQFHATWEWFGLCWTVVLWPLVHVFLDHVMPSHRRPLGAIPASGHKRRLQLETGHFFEAVLFYFASVKRMQACQLQERPRVVSHRVLASLRSFAAHISESACSELSERGLCSLCSSVMLGNLDDDDVTMLERCFTEPVRSVLPYVVTEAKIVCKQQVRDVRSLGLNSTH